MKALDAYNLGYRSGLIGDNMPAEADDASLVGLDRMQAGWLTGRADYLETSHNHLGGLVSYLLRNYEDDQWDDSTKEMIEDANAHLGGEPIKWSNEDDEGDEE